MSLQPVWKLLHPYPEVAEGRVTEDSFVVSIGAIWENLEFGKHNQVDPRYLDAEGFYRRTHFTQSIKDLLSTIIKRVDGEAVQSIHHLQVGMGGGKSHTLLLLYYLSKEPKKALPILKREGIATHVPEFRVAILDGMRLNANFRTDYPDGSSVNTFWGHLFKQLGVYEKFKNVDRLEESPGAPMLKETLAGKPTLILFDEIMSYIPNLLNYPRRLERMQAFLQALTTAVKETPGCALVITTPVGVYVEGQKYVTEILSRYCSPTPISGDKESKNIRRRALYLDDFQRINPTIEATAREYEKLYSRYLPNRAPGAVDQIRDNYPFHPFVDQTLKNLKDNPVFQNVRDELRFLVGLIYSVQSTKDPDASLITIGHARLEDKYVRGGTVSKLQDPVLLTRLDDELENRIPEIPVDLQPAARKALATIVLNSLNTTSPLQQGVSEEEANYALITPGSNPTLISESLKQIRKTLWFVDSKNDRYTFGRPNLNKIVDTWMRRIEEADEFKGRWWDKIQAELGKWHREATRTTFTAARENGASPLFNSGDVLTWVNRSDEIPDDTDLKLILTDYTISPTGLTRATNTPEKAAQAVKDLYETYGSTPRNYKNTVYFLVAGRTLVERDGPLDHAKQLMALEEMTRNKQQLLDLLGEQDVKYVDSMKADATRNFYPSTIDVYQYLVYPSSGGLAVIQLGEERRQIENLITIVEGKLRTQAKKVVDRVSPDTLLDRYWPKGSDRAEVKTIIEGFYRRPEIEVITSNNIAYDAVRQAVQEGKLAYVHGGETHYLKPLIDVRDDGILIRNPKVATIEVRAEDEAGVELHVTVDLDGREQKTTPAQRTDLQAQKHRVRVLAPLDYTFSGWSDGAQGEEREIEWSHNATYTARFKQPTVAPIEAVALSIYAVDAKANQSLNADFAIDNEKYTTPRSINVRKGKLYRVVFQVPKGYAFEGWSTGEHSTTLSLRSEIDTTLTARLLPIQPGAEPLTGSNPIRESIMEITSHLTRPVRETRLTFRLKSADLTRCYGALTMLHPPPYTIELAANAGHGKPIETLTIIAQATDQEQGDLKTLLTQLREYLNEAEITIHKKEEEYKPLNTIVSETALRALEKTEGTLTYRIIAMADPKLPPPTRTLQGALSQFKKV